MKYCKYYTRNQTASLALFSPMPNDTPCIQFPVNLIELVKITSDKTCSKGQPLGRPYMEVPEKSSVPGRGMISSDFRDVSSEWRAECCLRSKISIFLRTGSKIRRLARNKGELQPLSTETSRRMYHRREREFRIDF